MLHLLVDVANWGVSAVTEAYAKLLLEVQAETLEEHWPYCDGSAQNEVQRLIDFTRAEIAKLARHE
jgi:hypothetical protein